jgi:uncharacterized protein (TIGR02757 family)
MPLKPQTEAWWRIKELLDTKYEQFNRVGFIESDPVCIPHLFTKKEDIEIAGFLAATIAWGNRKSIITNATKLMDWMDNRPHDFVLNHSKKEQKPFLKFVHRTFNGNDCVFFLNALQHIYKAHGDLETVFSKGLDANSENIKTSIVHFRTAFLKTKHLHRSEKHISNPDAKSSAKRLCMYLRWMVRPPQGGVDFGIWKSISPALLCLPLDVHTGRVSRELGLLTRTQNDWQAVEEVTNSLKRMDGKDPVKYDFALFGLGVSGEM